MFCNRKKNAVALFFKNVSMTLSYVLQDSIHGKLFPGAESGKLKKDRNIKQTCHLSTISFCLHFLSVNEAQSFHNYKPWVLSTNAVWAPHACLLTLFLLNVTSSVLQYVSPSVRILHQSLPVTFVNYIFISLNILENFHLQKSNLKKDVVLLIG